MIIKNKYNNKKIMFNNIIFDSKDELKYYNYLLTKYSADQITLQPSYILQPKFKCEHTNKTIRAITYTADFKIGDIVIDVKGMQTEVFKIKAKLFKYEYPELQLIVGTSKELITQNYL